MQEPIKQETPAAPAAAPGAETAGPKTAGAEPPAARGRAIYADPLVWAIFAAALGLDQLTKWLVVSNLALGQSVPADGFFRITYVWNTGTAFGLFRNHGDVLTFISLAAVAMLVFFYRNAGRESLLVRLAVGLQLGGALGNIIDRLRLGHVTDFIDVGPWPIFNIADSSIVVGISLVVLYVVFASREAGQSRDALPGLGLSGSSGEVERAASTSSADGEPARPDEPDGSAGSR